MLGRCSKVEDAKLYFTFVWFEYNLYSHACGCCAMLLLYLSASPPPHHLQDPGLCECPQLRQAL